jgi:Predicted membrane protein/domain
VRLGLFSRNNEHEEQPQKQQRNNYNPAYIFNIKKETEVKTMEQDKCQQCGTPTLPDAKFCEQCGAQLHAEVEPQPQSVPSPASAPTYQTPSYVTEKHYEGVPIRFVAILIDTIIIAIIAGILSIPFQSQLSGAVSLLIFLLYFIVLEGAYGQTVGKMAVKIKVVKEDGSKIDYADAVVRNVLRLIDLIPYFIPYLLGAILIWTSDMKQRLGDRVAHTVVVKA